jgi:hypothetical protein
LNANVQVIRILWSTSTDWFQVPSVMAFSSRSTQESCCQNRLSNVGIGTEDLVNTKMFKKRGHCNPVAAWWSVERFHYKVANLSDAANGSKTFEFSGIVLLSML